MMIEMKSLVAYSYWHEIRNKEEKKIIKILNSLKKIKKKLIKIKKY